MSNGLRIRIVSPQETVFEGTATSVVAPAWDGQVGILPGHAPMITLLGAGKLSLDVADGEVRTFYLAQGVLKVEDDEVVILAEYVGPDQPEELEPSPFWPDPQDPLGGLSEPGNPLV